MSKRNKIITIIASLILVVPITIFINNNYFHKDEIVGKEGHYEWLVYITPHGECYHSKNCSYITITSAIGLEQAKSKGYRKCKHCNGVTYEHIWIEGISASPQINNYALAFSISFCVVLGFDFIIFNALKKTGN